MFGPRNDSIFQSGSSDDMLCESGRLTFWRALIEDVS